MTDGSPPRASWESLRQPGAPAPAAPPAADTPEEVVMRAMTTLAGRAFLAWLRAETIEKRNRPGASDAELREMEAQRQLVDRIARMAETGREIAASRNKAAKP